MIFALSPDVANLCGFAGAGGCLAGYAYTAAVSRPNPFVQHGLNFVGAALLVISLLAITNLASLVMEVLWCAIAAYGLARAIWLRGR